MTYSYPIPFLASIFLRLLNIHHLIFVATLSTPYLLGETRAEILAVTLSANRMAPDVNFTKIAENLEGYTGSDIKEVRQIIVLHSGECL